MNSLKKQPQGIMEAWGYAVIGFGALSVAPAFLYYLYFSTLGAEDTFQVSGTLQEFRVVDEQGVRDSNGSRTRNTYLELRLEGLAVPIRFHRPAFDPKDSRAPLAPPASAWTHGMRATVSAAKKDSDKLRTPPPYPPHRWVEGYSLEVEGKSWLELQAGIDVWRRDRKIALYLANAFTISVGGIFFFVLVYGLETYLLGVYLRRNAIPVPRLNSHMDKEAAERDSSIYYICIPGLIALNLPFIGQIDDWVFGCGYWRFFAGAVAVLQMVFYFHHRRYLHILDSRPRGRYDAPAGFFAYLTLTAILCLMITPFLQFLFRRFFS